LLRVIDFLHRWVGGVMGLALASIGLSGIALIHRYSWISLPGAQDTAPRSVEEIAAFTQAIMTDPALHPHRIIFAGDEFGLSRLAWAKGNGAYVDWAGNVVSNWDTAWGRPELWLFEFHHYLFAGDTGKTVVGIAGLSGIALVVMGIALWWRTRHSFEFRLLPRRLSRPAILRHHRDLGIIAAPLLLLSFATGSAMVFRPLTSVIFGPDAGPIIAKSLEAPILPHGAPASHLDWNGIITRAHSYYPDAEIRTLGLPEKSGDPVTIQLRRPLEWLPNGRTAVWFDPGTGQPIASRDAAFLPWQAKAFNALYPLHSGAAGGLFHRLLMTLAGLCMTLLGLFAVWTFWFKRQKIRK
jgi:uncharacterized iron-regulated membrane protein